MKVREMLYKLVEEYNELLTVVVDGQATEEQQVEMDNILEAIEHYTTRLMLAGNDEIEGTEEC